MKAARLKKYALEIHKKKLFIYFSHFLYTKMVVKHKTYLPSPRFHQQRRPTYFLRTYV